MVRAATQPVHPDLCADPAMVEALAHRLAQQHQVPVPYTWQVHTEGLWLRADLRTWWQRLLRRPPRYGSPLSLLVVTEVES